MIPTLPPQTYREQQPPISRPSERPPLARNTLRCTGKLPYRRVAIRLSVQPRRRDLVRMQMRAGLSQHFHMIPQPRSCGQEEGSVAAAIAKMDRRALGQKISQDFNVRSGRREVLRAREEEPSQHT